MEVGISRPLPSSNLDLSAEEIRNAKISKAAQDFEALFLATIVNEMLASSAPTSMNGGVGEEMFRSQLGNAFAQNMAEAGGVGIADSIEAAMRAYKE